MNDQHEQHVDLDREAVYDSAGRRITEEYVAEAVDAIERDDVTLDEDAAIYPQRGRPSLTRPGTHSPRVDLRVPQGTKLRLARCAHQTGRSESDVVRDAIDEYLARH